MDEFSWDTVSEIWKVSKGDSCVSCVSRESKGKSRRSFVCNFTPSSKRLPFFFFLFLKDYNNWWLLMRYLSSFALSRGREPKSIPPFCSSTRQISRLTNSLYKYTFFIPPFLGGSIQFIITHWDCTRVQFQFPI